MVTLTDLINEIKSSPKFLKLVDLEQEYKISDTGVTNKKTVAIYEVNSILTYRVLT